MSRILIASLAALLRATPAFAAHYEAELDPAPMDATTKPVLTGSIGNVTADLEGNILNIHGRFSNFTSNATTGSVRIGLAKGVPGDAIGNLTVTHAPQGEFSGSLKLNGAQVAALKKQALYIRIDSEKAPDGNVQGWLEETGT